jgi:hypothetical protein
MVAVFRRHRLQLDRIGAAARRSRDQARALRLVAAVIDADLGDDEDRGTAADLAAGNGKGRCRDGDRAGQLAAPGKYAFDGRTL